MKVTIVGLGKIGLPLGVQFATRGLTVIGADIDADVVDAVNAGRPPFPNEPDLDRLLVEVVGDGRLAATTDTAAAVAASDAVVVVVPLVVDDDLRPDFRAIDAATADVARGLTADTLVCYETTLPVGTTRGRFAPALAQGSGLTLGEDLFVAFSPERISSGTAFVDFRRYPKLVGGVDAASAARAVAFYEAGFVFDDRPDLGRPNGVWDLGSAEAAELAKLAETTYRDVNIALANEFATYAESIGVDYAAVAAACNSQPYSHLHRPGVAVGGHCIPVYPRFYLAGDPAARLPAVAREVNLAMPARTVERLGRALGGLRGATIVVLGAAYRGGVKETAFSGVFDVVRELSDRGARPVVHDPLHRDDELAALGLVPYGAGSPVDGAIVQADHAEYGLLGPDDLPGVRVLVDGRGITEPARWTGVVRLVVGQPDPQEA